MDKQLIEMGVAVLVMIGIGVFFAIKNKGKKRPTVPTLQPKPPITIGDNRNKWTHRFLNRAIEVSRWSKDPSTKVGACIAKGKKVLAEGYNGMPAGIKDTDERLNDREFRIAMTIHAEENAILHCNAEDKAESTLFVTSNPCSKCAAKIIQSGICRVVYIENEDPAYLERWGEDSKLANEMFKERGIHVITYKRHEVLDM